MPHTFDPREVKKLEYPERFQEEPFAELSALLPLNSMNVILDLGCGSGFYTFPLAHFSAPDAKVYALDTSDKMIEFLQKNIQHGTLVKPISSIDVSKIIPEVIKPNRFSNPKQSVDLLFCAKVFHELDNLPQFLKETKRVLKKGGSLFIMDWQKKPMEKGPPLEHRIDLDDGIKTLEQNNFKIIKSGELFKFYYYLIAQPMV
jgi:ubiquinone/menaquinone biosynthesis C-methylase UbiE